MLAILESVREIGRKGRERKPPGATSEGLVSGTRRICLHPHGTGGGVRARAQDSKTFSTLLPEGKMPRDDGLYEHMVAFRAGGLRQNRALPLWLMPPFEGHEHY